FFPSRRRHTRSKRDWSSDVCSSDLPAAANHRNGRQHLPGDEAALQEAGGAEALVHQKQVVALQLGQDLAHPGALALQAALAVVEIGRASCRERVECWEGGGSVNTVR